MSQSNQPSQPSQPSSILEVAIIGAGVAGITCAQQLHQAGYSLALVEKSRGLGGRLAKRRLPAASAGPTHADHGVCYLKPEDAKFAQLIERLCGLGLMQVWTDQIHGLGPAGEVIAPRSRSPRYAAPQGITVLAKALAQGLTIHNSQRAVGLAVQGTGQEQIWEITTDQGLMLRARALVLAVPTPQAIALIDSLPKFDPATLARLHRVEFSQGIAAIAVYDPEHQAKAAQLPWRGINCQGHPSLAWIGLESSKQLNPQQPVVVVHSNPAFGQAQFEADDRGAVGQTLLDFAAEVAEAPWLAEPEKLQVHRWGYAFPQTPLPERCLQAQGSPPLWFVGDWCGGDSGGSLLRNRVESAFLSGLAAADQLHQQLAGKALPDLFWKALI